MENDFFFDTRFEGKTTLDMREMDEQKLNELSVEEIYEQLVNDMPHVDHLAFKVYAEKLEKETGKQGSLINPVIKNCYLRCCEQIQISHMPVGENSINLKGNWVFRVKKPDELRKQLLNK